MPGLVVGRIFDMGYTKLPLTIASALLVAATFLTAQCKEYWQFLLCQGFATGVCYMPILDHLDCIDSPYPISSLAGPSSESS